MNTNQNTYQIVIVSTSLNPESKSKRLAESSALCLRNSAESHGIELEVQHVELSQLPVCYCDGRDHEEYPTEWQHVAQLIEESDAVILSHPVYNYGPSGSTFTFLEIVGEALEDKVVTVLSAAGSMRSHLASSSLLHSLFYEFGCYIYPDTVQITGDQTIDDPSLSKRVSNLSEGLITFMQRMA